MSLNSACVISAINSTTVDGELLDYVRMASIAAERVKHYLGIDTYLMTDNTSHLKSYPIFKDVIISKPTNISKRAMFADGTLLKYNWANDTRIDAFNLTKGLADRILMIDADYMIASDLLKQWLVLDYPFIMFDRAVDVVNRNEFKKYTESNDIVHRWATAMCWNHSDEAEVIFETARMVRDNYEFYASMLGVIKELYRNDLAFSVACHLHNIPVNDKIRLWNLDRSAFLYKVKDRWIVDFEKNVVSWEFDIHVLNKKYAIYPELMDQLRLTHAEI